MPNAEHFPSPLFAYRPRDGRTSLEDFFTEAFAAVLQANRNLCGQFVKWLIDSDEVDDVHIATQNEMASSSNKYLSYHLP